jgi:hypothetical protein
MNTMPYTIKQKLRQYDKALKKARVLHDEIMDTLEQYGVPYDNLVAEAEDGESTEALTYISHCEGNIEDNIELIEEVFLSFVNKSK